MMNRHETRRPGRRGVAMIVAIMFLTLFACLAVVIATSASANLNIAHNRIEGQQAASVAAASIQLMQKSLGGTTVSGAHDAAGMHALIAARLQEVFVGSAMVDANGIAITAAGVVIPPIALSRTDGRSGQVSLSIQASGGAQDNTTVTIRSTGHFGGATRSATYNMTVQRGQSVLANYGIASRSAITMTGNSRIVGAHRAAEASVLSATYSTQNALQMTGNIFVAGDVGVCNPSGHISKTGNVTIGGSQIIGAPEPEWPEVDITDFKPYATNVYTGNGSGNLTLSNIRIPPGTNPNFSGNVVIYGVVYIQPPNKVTFSGNATLIGVIVADPPSVDNLSTNQVKFTGNLSTAGVENLPSGHQYDGLRDLTGSFLLTPGFSAQFTGNFNTVNGCMIASEFKFTGNAGGLIRGGVVNLRDSTFAVTGNANLTIDRDGAVEHPAGVRSNYKLVCVSGSYAE